VRWASHRLGRTTAPGPVGPGSLDFGVLSVPKQEEIHFFFFWVSEILRFDSRLKKGVVKIFGFF
jgi:hypothetical protein